jgi:hypothetical protein
MLGGALSAVLCIVGRQVIYNFPDITIYDISYTLLNRVLIGFVIGISAWRIHHLIHGAIIGLIVTLTVSLGFLPGSLSGFFLYTSAGIFYGILIEWLATDVFKAPMKK